MLWSLLSDLLDFLDSTVPPSSSPWPLYSCAFLFWHALATTCRRWALCCRRNSGASSSSLAFGTSFESCFGSRILRSDLGWPVGCRRWTEKTRVTELGREQLLRTTLFCRGLSCKASQGSPLGAPWRSALDEYEATFAGTLRTSWWLCWACWCRFLESAWSLRLVLSTQSFQCPHVTWCADI